MGVYNLLLVGPDLRLVPGAVLVGGRHHGKGRGLRRHALLAPFGGPRWEGCQDVRNKEGRQKDGRGGGWRKNDGNVVGVAARWRRRPPQKGRGDRQRRSRYVLGWSLVVDFLTRTCQPPSTRL